MNLYCTRCGKPFNGTRICQNCGFQFDENDISALLHEQRRKSDNKNLGIVLAIVFVSMFLVGLCIAAAIFIPALVGYKAKVEQNKNLNEYYKSQAYVSEQAQNEGYEEEYFSDNDSYELSENFSGDGYYESGNYEVGKDLPSGKYLVLSDTTAGYGDFCFGVYSQSDCSDESQLSFNWYQGSAYVILEEGTFIHFSHSNMYKAENDISLNTVPFINQTGGMYEVGRDLEPGYYKLEKNNDQYSVEYTVYLSIDSVSPVIKEQAHLDRTDTEIYLSEGEYIMVKFGKPVKID